MNSKILLTFIGWLLVCGGGYAAHLVQTSGGAQVSDVRFEFEPGRELSALLYRPASATEQHPAPGILAVHGYINSRETQSGFAIEFARRGHVVLAIDQTGHGFSDGVAFSAGFGGPAALRYLRGLPFVDPDNIGLEGHSMGGWTSLAAAADQPDGYQSIALVGSSTGAPFALEGTPQFPRNLAVIFSRYDEFAELMWGVDRALDVADSRKLQSVFGVDQTIESQQLYGSIEAGTARWLSMPVTTHPGDHLSNEAIGDALSWMALTLQGGTSTDVSDQIWYWKELATLVAFIGGICVLLGTFSVLLGSSAFAALAGSARGLVSNRDRRWWMTLVLISAVPALSFFPLTALGVALSPNALFPQGVTNQIMVWALGNGVIGLLIAKLLTPEDPAQTAPKRSISYVLRSLLLSVLVVGFVYLALLLSDVLFTTDFRFWVVALKLLAPHHLTSFLAYLLPFTVFFYLSQAGWLRTMSLRGSAISQYGAAIAANAGGLLIMLMVIYGYLFIAGRLPGVDPLFSIVAIQFVPILAVTSVISVYTWRRTGSPLTGAMICGLLVTWYVVAGQATHVGL